MSLDLQARRKKLIKEIREIKEIKEIREIKERLVPPVPRALPDLKV
ncbi:MAG: hypothetical protein WKF73_03790 [Nocardioidaceae bacterium]